MLKPCPICKRKPVLKQPAQLLHSAAGVLLGCPSQCLGMQVNAAHPLEAEAMWNLFVLEYLQLESTSAAR
jgi:hypothetical protein